MISKSTQLISICATLNKELQGTQYILGDLHPLTGKSGLDMYDTKTENVLHYLLRRLHTFAFSVFFLTQLFLLSLLLLPLLHCYRNRQ